MPIEAQIDEPRDRTRLSPGQTESTERAPASLGTERLSAWYGERAAIRDISLTFARGQITAIIGPSGCGKSTLVRCLNRLHEVTPGARVEGRVLLDGEDIYAPGVDPVLVR